MNLLYAAILVCWPSGQCVSVTDDFGPYATRDECAARLAVMEAAAVIVFAHLPGVTMLKACADLDTLRRVIPDAYEGEEVA
jgi:hypothetical protein